MTYRLTPDQVRVRVGRKSVPMDQATTGQLQIAALKAFPSSPYQLAIRAEINRRSSIQTAPGKALN